MSYGLKLNFIILKIEILRLFPDRLQFRKHDITVEYIIEFAENFIFRTICQNRTHNDMLKSMVNCSGFG